MAMTGLGKELRKLRIDLGATLAGMANTLGISSAYLSSIETGKKPAPTDFVDQLAKHYAAVQQQRHEFEVLVNQARQEVVLRLGEASTEEYELATALARRFSTMSQEQRDALQRLLHKGDE